MRFFGILMAGMWMFFAGLATAEAQFQYRYPANRRPYAYREAAKAQDFDLLKLVAGRRGAGFVQGRGMVVTQLLPDDLKGLPHQKWMVQLSDGTQIMAVSNMQLCPRIPLRPGDVIGLGGEFIWTAQGGIIHWLHSDPSRRRPNGYVEVNGNVYCQ